MSRKRLVALLVVLASLPAGLGAAAGAPADPGCAPRWWPQPRQNACGNASAGNAAAPSPATVADLELAWTYRASGTRMSQPIVWAEPQMRRPAVYVVNGGRLHAVDLATGRLRWTARAGGSRDAGVTPVAHADVLLAVNSSGVVRRYVPRSGHIVWQRTIGFGPEVIADGNWYANVSGVQAVEERTGRFRWERLVEGLSDKVAAAGGRVYVTGNIDAFEGGRSALHALDARTGKTVWTASPRGPYEALFSPVVADGRVFVRSLTGRAGSGPFSFFLDAFSAADGEHLWRAPVGVARGFWSTPPAADGSLVVQPTENGRLYAVDAATGAPRWTVAGDNSVPAAIVNSLVWAADESGRRIVAVDTATGRMLWTSPAFPVDEGTQRFAPSPVVAGGFLLLGSWDGRLLAYRVPKQS